MNWRLSAEEISFILMDSAPRIVFADQEYQETIKGLKGTLPSVKAYYSLGSGTQGISFPLLLFLKAEIKEALWMYSRMTAL